MKFLASIFVLLLTPALAAAQNIQREDPDNPVVLAKTNLGDFYLELFPKAAPKTVANFVGLAEGTREFTDHKTGKKTKRHFYDGLIFHRVIKNFMIQGGDPKGNGSGGPGYTFEDEINADALGLDKIKVVQESRAIHPYLLVRSKTDFQRVVLMPLFRAMGIRSQEELVKRTKEIKKKLPTLTIKGAYENLGYKFNAALKSRRPKRGALAMANSGPDTNGSQFFVNLRDTPHLTGKHTVFGKVVKGMEVVERIGETEVGPGGKPLKKVKIISIRLLKK
ncbi:MAG: peptidylprolyl isomerase [bacterium]